MAVASQSKGLEGARVRWEVGTMSKQLVQEGKIKP